MIVVIKCAASKVPDSGHLVTAGGTRVTFVAHPEIPPKDNEYNARPYDAGRGKSWRHVLLAYNRGPNGNPLRLLPAYRLYQNLRGAGPAAPGWMLVKFDTTTTTNWRYERVNAVQDAFNSSETLLGLLPFG